VKFKWQRLELSATPQGQEEVMKGVNLQFHKTNKISQSHKEKQQCCLGAAKNRSLTTNCFDVKLGSSKKRDITRWY
jgi:hypothetical protein